jgi:hypothetical protein
MIFIRPKHFLRSAYTGLPKIDLNFMMKIELPAAWLAKGHDHGRPEVSCLIGELDLLGRKARRRLDAMPIAKCSNTQLPRALAVF